MWSPARTGRCRRAGARSSRCSARTASAVPRYHSATRPRAMYGCSSRMPPRVAVEVPRPAEPDVVVQGARVVLRQDEDVVDPGVDAVREREVDDPVLAAERAPRAWRARTRGSTGAPPRRLRGRPPASASCHAPCLPTAARDGDRSTGYGRAVNGRSAVLRLPTSVAGAGCGPRRTAAGSTNAPLNRTAQCRCAPVEWPVLPS